MFLLIVVIELTTVSIISRETVSTVEYQSTEKETTNENDEFHPAGSS